MPIPIGETITTDAGIPLKITLVFADLPANTHLKYDLLFSRTTRRSCVIRTTRRSVARQLVGVGDYHLSADGAGLQPGRLAAHQR